MKKKTYIDGITQAASVVQDLIDEAEGYNFSLCEKIFEADKINILKTTALLLKGLKRDILKLGERE